jgi:hypothetical protein
MRPRTVHRLRYALRLVASVFFLSSPCAGQTAAGQFHLPPAPLTAAATPDAAAS